MARKGV
jgi:superfamily II DNA helicase RecQ